VTTTLTPKKNQKGIGAQHWAAKMTAAKVRQARKSYATGRYTIADLARKYEITPPSMGQIIHRRTWRHVA